LSFAYDFCVAAFTFTISRTNTYCLVVISGIITTGPINACICLSVTATFFAYRSSVSACSTIGVRELWLECRNCGTVYPKHETKVKPVLEPIVKVHTNPFGKSKIQGIERKKKRTGRGNNPRIKPTEQIKDEDLQRELKDGAVLVSYSSTDSIT
jgi:hypothetical protein